MEATIVQNGYYISFLQTIDSLGSPFYLNSSKICSIKTFRLPLHYVLNYNSNQLNWHGLVYSQEPTSTIMKSTKVKDRKKGMIKTFWPHNRCN